MKFVSFSLPTPMGPQIRTGVLDAAGGIVDLAAACRASLLGEGLAPAAAVRLSEALLPGDMVAFDRGRRTVARRRAPGAAVGGRRGARRRRRGHRLPGGDDSISCRRCPGRRCCATSWASKRTCATSTRSWGARSRPSGADLPVYSRATPAASGPTATTFRFRRTPRRSISSSNWRWSSGGAA